MTKLHKCQQASMRIDFFNDPFFTIMSILSLCLYAFKTFDLKLSRYDLVTKSLVTL